ncbi:ribosome maturation factor RimM [Brachybacterium sp. JHP9]|uniref:Ribosome maturation factor RimM n=1 Tax=Brachybacterium equifaecis TaxID=2910770 RepID=A0ABT0QWT5_9MICO|nr:ribosome maturation factor RimM [Brachybacterium equifaecis]MCL6422128.1 ribosome maturation factor RimM [Brachybacterium equifaecis]
MTTRDVTIATIGKAHGLRGEVSLILRTDQPEERLQDGTVFEIAADEGARTLTIVSTRLQQGRWYAKFAEVSSRTDAEALRGAVLSLEIDLEEEAEEDPDAWYPSDLKGLAVRHVDGRELGTVLDLELHPAQDLLIVRGLDGRRVMLPFVEALVPEVDVEGGIVLADPPGGLFEDLPEDDDEDVDATESPAEGV